MRRDLRDKLYEEMPTENPKKTEDLMAQLHEAPYGTIPDHEWALIFDRAFEKIQALRTGVRMIDGAYDEVKGLTEKLQAENEKLRAENKILHEEIRLREVAGWRELK